MSENASFVTVGEAAELLGVTTTTLRNWDKAGKLAARRDPINGYRLYDIQEVSALLRERSTVSYQPTDTESPGLRGDLQPSLFALAPVEEPSAYTDTRSLRLLVRQMSRAFRDSMGGGLLERFEEITKLLYCKMYDEQKSLSTKDYKKHFFYNPSDSVEDTYTRIGKLYDEAIGLLPDIFANGYRELSGDKKAVITIVSLLQDVDILSIPADVKGIVYEELIRNTFEKTENQQFFTPRTIVEFMVQFVEPESKQFICDPACGSGGFLIESANYIKSTSSLTRDEPSQGKIIGLEIDRLMAWVAQMNLMMHGDGHGVVYYLKEGGSLAFSERLNTIIQDNSLDLILTNPPFGSDFSDSHHLQKYQLGKGKAARRRGVLFIERCIRWLRPGGRLAIIIDDSVLNGKSNKDTRLLILDNCIIEAIISLPDVAFMPYATAKASIVFLRKKQQNETEQPDVFMADAENVGRKANGDPLWADQRDHEGRPTLLNDLPRILKAWRAYKIEGESALFDSKPKIFSCPAKRFTRFRASNQDIRLDVQYHHPSREIAEEALTRSIYPTPRLAELVIVRNITVIPAKQDPDEIWNYMGLANITAYTGEYTVVQVYGEQIKSSVRLYRSGDILFSKLRPELRKVILIDEGEDEGYVSSECLVLSVNNPQVDPKYLEFILRGDIVYGQLVYEVTGVGRPRISSTTLLGLRIPLPPLEVQREIVASYQMAWTYQLECRRRSEAALLEGARAVQHTYIQASQRLCPER